MKRKFCHFKSCISCCCANVYVYIDIDENNFISCRFEISASTSYIGQVGHTNTDTMELVLVVYSIVLNVINRPPIE